METYTTEDNFRILVVDDDIDLSAGIKEALEVAGYIVEATNNGKDAINLSQSNRYDIALVDLKLPDISGIELVTNLASVSPSMEFVIITAYAALDSAIDSVKQSRIISYEHKPLDFNHIQSLLKQFCKRKKIELKLRKSEKIYNTLVDTTQDAFINITNGIIFEWNKSAEKLFGYSKDEIIGQPVNILIPDKYKKEHPEGFERFIKTGETSMVGKIVEIEGVTKEGAEIPIEMSLTYQKLGKEQHLFMAIIRDISKHKRSEGRLKAQHFISKVLAESTTIKDAYPRILQAVCIAMGWDLGEIWESNQQSKPLYNIELWHVPFLEFSEFKAATKNITFLPEKGLPGRIWKSTKPLWIEDVTKDKDFHRASTADKEGLHGAFGFPIISCSKVLGIICFFSHEIRKPDKDILDMMAAVGHQIGLFIKRKQAEEGLKSSERKMRTWIENSPVCTKIVDLDYSLQYMSAAGIKNLKIDDISQLYGKPYPFDFYPESFRNIMVNSLGKAKETGRIVQQEGSVLDIEDNELWFHSTIVPVNDDVGQIEYFIVSSIDTTKHKKMEKELLKVQKLESLGVIAGSIAHDFNNVLAGILGMLALIKMDTDREDMAYERLEEVEKITLKAGNLTKQFLTFSKGGAPVRVTASIRDVINEATKLSLSGSNVKCSSYVPDDLWLLEIDKGQIGQVINNLIINAVQAMPEGGTIKVWSDNVSLDNREVPTLKSGDYVKITLKDQGSGIPKEHIGKIFDPFFTTKKKGSGLGLSSCYSVIKNHGGYISVESEVGKGTTFNVHLPASDKDVLEMEEIKENLIAGGGKVLVMDDDEQIRSTMGKILKKLGYEVELAGDGDEAVMLYRKAKESGEPLAVVLIDLTIAGGMGGEVTVTKLLEIDPEVKAILCSGYSNSPIMTHFKEYGFCAVIQKPFEIKALSRILHDVIKA